LTAQGVAAIQAEPALLPAGFLERFGKLARMGAVDDACQSATGAGLLEADSAFGPRRTLLKVSLLPDDLGQALIACEAQVGHSRCKECASLPGLPRPSRIDFSPYFRFEIFDSAPCF